MSETERLEALKQANRRLGSLAKQQQKFNFTDEKIKISAAEKKIIKKLIENAKTLDYYGF